MSKLDSVPAIDEFEGIRICIYYNEHLPPHVHALYSGYEALVEIRTCNVYAGDLPAKQMKKVVNWLVENRKEALKIFFQFNPRLK